MAATQAVQAKAAEYLLGGHVRIDHADRGVLSATVTGSKPYPYTVAYYAESWHCTCPASRLCAHIVACQAIWQPAAARQVA